MVKFLIPISFLPFLLTKLYIVILVKLMKDYHNYVDICHYQEVLCEKFAQLEFSPFPFFPSFSSMLHYPEMSFFQLSHPLSWHTLWILFNHTSVSIISIGCLFIFLKATSWASLGSYSSQARVHWGKCIVAYLKPSLNPLLSEFFSSCFSFLHFQGDQPQIVFYSKRIVWAVYERGHPYTG